MASNVYLQHYADGTSARRRRAVKQGRKPLPNELVKVPVTIFVLPKTKAEIKQKAKSLNMSVSAFGEAALVLFDISKYSAVENC